MHWLNGINDIGISFIIYTGRAIRLVFFYVKKDCSANIGTKYWCLFSCRVFYIPSFSKM